MQWKLSQTSHIVRATTHVFRATDYITIDKTKMAYVTNDEGENHLHDPSNPPVWRGIAAVVFFTKVVYIDAQLKEQNIIAAINSIISQNFVFQVTLLHMTSNKWQVKSYNQIPIQVRQITNTSSPSTKQLNILRPLLSSTVDQLK